MVESVKQRRRLCRSCRHSFTTYEIGESEFEALCKLIEESGPLRRSLRTKRLTEGKSDDNSVTTDDGNIERSSKLKTTGNQ